jgi:hypothetical protein
MPKGANWAIEHVSASALDLVHDATPPLTRAEFSRATPPNARCQQEERTMCRSSVLKGYLGIAFIALCVAVTASSQIALAAEDTQNYKVAGGLAVYLGVVPAQMIQGHPSSHPERQMHGGPPRGPHDHHIVVSVFDAASGARIEDAIVTAKVTGLGLSGSQQQLEAMAIANTITYGGYFRLPEAALYTVRVTIQRPQAERAVGVEFKYDLRR